MPDLIEAPVVVDTGDTLADHEQAFAPAAIAKEPPVRETTERADDGVESEPSERDANGQFKPRARAKSQRAGADDVETINAYTKRIREAEDALGIKVERKEGESDRVYNLRRRAEIMEAKREAAKEQRREPEMAARPAPKPPQPFNEPEPKYEDFANEPDQYQAHLRALTAWDRRRETAEGAIKSHETQAHEAIAERNARRDAWFKEQEVSHLSRMEQYHQEHPEAQAILDQAGDVRLTPALYSAVMTSENSPELLILVAKNEELRDDLNILTEGKPLNKDLVAYVQRRLNRGLTSANTGSDTRPAQPIPAVPRPPNPVRTGPMKTSDTPPGDEDSLAAHEKFYGGKRR